MKNSIIEQYRNRHYAVSKRLETIGNNTIADLVAWLETFVNIVFPDNAIYYWNAPEKRHKVPASSYFICSDSIPKYVSTLDGPHHAICYVRDGASEGYMIEVAYMMRDNTFKYVCNAKYLGWESDAWDIARTLSYVLNTSIGTNEWPMIVDMYLRLPRKYNGDRKANLLESVKITSTTHYMKVHTQSGRVFEEVQCHESEDSTVWRIESLKYDWLKVLTSLDVKVELDTWLVQQDDRLSCLVGQYYLTTRAHALTVEEGNAIGWYILLPYANPSLDSSYLGKFDDIDTAVAAATAHHDAKTQTLAA